MGGKTGGFYNKARTAHETVKGVARTAFPKLSLAAKAVERPVEKVSEKMTINRLKRSAKNLGLTAEMRESEFWP